MERESFSTCAHWPGRKCQDVNPRARTRGVFRRAQVCVPVAAGPAEHLLVQVRTGVCGRLGMLRL